MKLIPRAARLLACALPLAPVAPILLRATSAMAQPLPERRSITGRVTRGDGTGVPRAGVTIRRQEQESDGAFAFWGAETSTDERGYFSFPDAEEGAYFLSIEVEGYAKVENKPLRADENSSDWNIRLERLATLSLRLVGADGAPVKAGRAVVRLSRAELAAPPLVRRQLDGGGGIVLRDLSPGRYSLDVAVPGAGFAALRDVEVKYLDKPQPVDIKLARGGNLKVVARDANDQRFLGGATLSLSATLEPGEDDRREGRLGARSLAKLEALYAPSRDGSGAVTREGEGALELRDLPPGRYRAKLVLPSYAPSETREVEVKAGQDAVAEFVLAPQVRASSLKVRLLDKNNAPIAGREWTLQLRSLGAAPAFGAPPPDAPGILAIEPGARGDEVVELGGAGFGTLMRRARSDDKGEITLFPLRAGRWRITAFSSSEDERPSNAIAQRDAAVSDEGSEVTLNFRTEFKDK